MSLTHTQSRHIQILRGLAIIAVVFIHNAPIGLSQVFIRPFLNFCVGTFLFLSGFLSDRNSWNPKKRLVKVLIPYIIWTFIYVFINYRHSRSEIPSEFFKSLFLGDSVAIMYYIFVYCQFTLLIPLIDKIANSKYKYIGFIISPLEIIFMRTLPIIMGYKNNAYLQNIISISCLGWFTYFYLGYLIGNKKITVKYSNSALLIFLATSVFIQMSEGYWYWSLGYTNCGTQLKLSVVLSSCIFVLLGYKFINSEKECKCKLLYTLGNYSFGIYFSHMSVMWMLSLIPSYSKYVVYPFNAVIAVAGTFVLCYVVKKLLKKHSWILAL